MTFGPEYIDQSSGIHRVYMLREQGQPRLVKRAGEAFVNLAQAPDRGEQAERAAADAQNSAL